jgi:hypothetical protein
MKTRLYQIITCLTLLALVLTLSACGKEEPTATPVPPTNTPAPPTNTPVPPTDTPVPPTPTPTPVPPTPTPTKPPALDLTAEYTDEEAGISLQLPAEWAAISFFGVTFIAESEEAVGLTATGEMPDLVAIVAAGSAEDLDIDLAEIEEPADLFEMTDELPLSGDSEIGEIEELKVDGYPAAAAEITNADLDSEEPMNGYFMAVMLEDQDRFVMFIGATVLERWEEVIPTFKAIAQSMTFFEPKAAEIPVSEVDLADEPFVNEANGYSIAYPDGWQSMDMDTMVIFVQDLMTMNTDMPTAIVVMADTIEAFLGGALVGISQDDLEAVMALAATQMGEDMELGDVETLTVDDAPAAGAELIGTSEETANMTGYVVLALGDTQAAMIMAMAPQDQWTALEPVFWAMLDTFTFTGQAAGPSGPSGPVASGDAGQSRANPIPMGQMGSAAQWNIQVQEVVRGDEAWDMLLAASDWNDPPIEGFEYVVVKIAAERTGDSAAKEIGLVDFNITGAENVLHQPVYVTDPEPALDAELLPGGTTEGWLSFAVWEGEENLILVYDEPIYFALAEGAAVELPTDLMSDGDASSGTSRAAPAEFEAMLFQDPWEFQVLEVIHGDEAYDLLMEANMFNDPPGEGLEYMLLEIWAQNLDTMEEAQTIDGSMFHVTADNNILYRYPYVVEPDPQFDARLYPGGEWTGWLGFEIGVGEENPMLVFGDVFDLDEAGRFVALEEGAAVAFPTSIEIAGEQDLGTSLGDPAPAGTVIATEQWEFTVLEVLRGDEAWDALYEASEYNDEPEAGMEYVLVRAEVRNITDEDEPKLCDSDLFDIVGENKEIYDKPYPSVPDPELSAWLYPDGETEGWIALQAAEGEGGLTLILSDSYFSEDQRYLSLEE